MAERGEFRVSIEGIDLEPEVADRISQAVQKAVLAKLARVDRLGDFAARIRDGGTQGIQVIAL